MQSGMISLSTYDIKFVQSLYALTLQKTNLTTNQVALFTKLTEKYKRQLAKQGISSITVGEIPWESSIVPSDPKYTEAYVDIKNGLITFRSPFNQKFIEAFRKITYNPFAWSKEERAYIATYSTHSLKLLLSKAINYYPVVNYCPVTLDLLNRLDSYDATYWNPTLVKINDTVLLAAANEKLINAIADIPLTVDPTCVSTLALYGIEFDTSITNNDPLLEFASKFIVDVDFKDIDQFVEHLVNIQCDGVFMEGNTGMTMPYKKLLADKLKSANIQTDQRHAQVLESRIVDYKNPVLITLSTKDVTSMPQFFKKIIRMRNSLPVKIK
jgi:hypothetical protein